MSKKRFDMIIDEIFTKEDCKNDSIYHNKDKLYFLLNKCEKSNIDKVLDIGCGGGAVTKTIGEYFKANEIHGIEINSDLIKKAEKKNINVHNINVETQILPYENDSFDLITSFGLLEHLKYYDNVLQEINRVLKKGGYLIITVPNLTSWINRISLLFGWQPRSIEISTESTVNTPPLYENTSEILYQIRPPSHKGLIELLEFYNFNIEQTIDLTPYQQNTLVKIMDKIASHNHSLARRVGYIAIKSKDI